MNDLNVKNALYYIYLWKKDGNKSTAGTTWINKRGLIAGPIARVEEALKELGFHDITIDSVNKDRILYPEEIIIVVMDERGSENIAVVRRSVIDNCNC